MKPLPTNPVDRALPPVGYYVAGHPNATPAVSVYQFKGVSSDAGTAPRP